MKRAYRLFLPLILWALFLSACGPSQPSASQDKANAPTMDTQVAEVVNQQMTLTAPTVTQTMSESTGTALNTDYENAVSLEMQLLLGTFKLEGTDRAVTKEQAAILLPLWTEFQILSQSTLPQGGPGQPGQGDATPQLQNVDPEVQNKLAELTKQIQAALTSDQIQAIAEMKITPKTTLTILEAQGIQMGEQQPQQGMPPAGGPGGAQGEAGAPPNGGQAPGGSSPSAPQAGQKPVGGFIPPTLLKALIELLQNKAA